MIARQLPVLLLLAGLLLLLVTGRPLFSDGTLSAKQDRFRSLATASPILDTLIAISVIGKPFLEHLQKNDWQTDLLAPTPLLVVVSILVASLYAMLGSILFFFYRAIQNINHFNGRRVRSPYSAFLMIVPITNLVVIPYIEYFAYQRSRALAGPHGASALRAALLAIAAFGLLLVSLICGRLGDAASEPAMYDAASLMFIGTLTGLAGGILTTRIVDGIVRAQEAYALEIGALPNAGAGVAPRPASRRLDALKSAAVWIMVTLAILAALFPALASQAVRTMAQVLSGA